ncbi:DUF397 domain-containing protein [Streptomyces noursei]
MSEAINVSYTNSNAPEAHWVKSSESDLDHSQDCVLLAALGDGLTGITDSKDPNAPILRMNPREIAAFIQGAKNGEFDRFTTS